MALPDSDAALLKYIARELGDLRRHYGLNGLHWPPELESLRLLVANDGQGRPTFDVDAEVGDRLAVTYDDVARRLSVSSRTVRRLIANGELPGVMIGGCARVTVADLQAFTE